MANMVTQPSNRHYSLDNLLRPTQSDFVAELAGTEEKIIPCVGYESTPRIDYGGPIVQQGK